MTDLRVTQDALELLARPAAPALQVTQLVAEVLSAIEPPPVLLALARRAAGLDRALTFAQRPDGTNEIYSPRTLELGTDTRVEMTAPDGLYVNGGRIVPALTQLTGDVTAGPGSGSQAATIAPDAVTYAKLQNVSAASRLLGRGSTAGAGDPEEITLGSGLTISGTTLNGARNSALVNYTYNSGAEPPNAGQIRADTGAPFTATTKLWIRFVSSDDQDVYWGLMVLSVGSTLILQDKDDHTIYTRFRITGAPIDKGLYAEVPVVWTANGATIITASRVIIQATALSAAPRTGTISLVIDGGGSVITTGVKTYLEVPLGCTIQAATLLADVSGSIVIDVWKVAYASYPPTVTNTITASAKPTISSALKSQDLTLTGWTTAITAGDILGFNVDSVSTIKRVTLSLKIQAS